MSTHTLRLYHDRLDAGASITHPAATRVVYVAEGMAGFAANGAAATLDANSSFCHGSDTSVTARADAALLFRYELRRAEERAPTGAILEADLTLDDPDGYLLRCDKVELPPGGIAYTHTHQGGGIRCLVEGKFNVTVHGETKAIDKHGAWFEAGPDPVYAWAPDDAVGHFSRVMILPRRLKGKSSIRYVNDADADKPKLQKYTIFADEFIDT